MAGMDEKRMEPRILCADLVEIVWCDKSGEQLQSVANLEDISLSGACIHLERPVLQGTAVIIRYSDGQFCGDVQYCLYRDLGYFLGVQFAEGYRWSREHFKPQHMLDPRNLLKRASKRPPQPHESQ